ncbi:Calmodulin (EF-Hand superfamily) [Phytophthora cinnamomi]|uniref:Calmodulin (EF-Hand superfamily) n=1 Tax=Phytophthora cinnamomi TaxID=4785 RepID=UPI00355A55B1|nr:Calmodulin (EF-Hand superfamily) [Phytophthora cinnamomi]
MTSAREGSGAGAMTARARDLHRKLLERVLVRSDSQNVKDVFRRYDRERAGVLTVDQFRALVRDHDFLDADAELLLRHLGAKDQQSVSFHAFMGDVQLGAEQNYPSKSIAASNSPKKVQQLTQLAETQQQKNAPQPQTKGKAKAGAKKTAVEMIQDPMEAIRTKLRERVIGHNKSIREVFMEYDTDGSGFLDHEKFGRFMAKYKFTPDETQIIVDYLDRDASGTYP